MAERGDTGVEKKYMLKVAVVVVQESEGEANEEDVRESTDVVAHLVKVTRQRKRRVRGSSLPASQITLHIP